MKICNNCNKEIEGNIKYCNYCGEKMNDSSINVDSQKIPPIFIIIVFIAVLVNIKLPDVSIDFVLISVIMILGMPIFALFTLILVILKKETKFAISTFKASAVLLLASFIGEMFGLKPIIFSIGMYLIYKYYRLERKKSIEVKELKEQRNKEKLMQEEIKNLQKIIKWKITKEKTKQEKKKILYLIFMNKNMKTKFENFIVKHTKKYDYGEIETKKYLEKTGDFLEYINMMIDMDKEIIQKTKEKNLDYSLNDFNKITIDQKALLDYLNDNKKTIYIENMSTALNIEDYTDLNKIIRKYLDTYGDNGLKGINLKILSALLEEDLKDIEEIVILEHDEMKKEYRKKQLEENLFSSTINKMSIEDVDKLDGFEFEDYLEELLISFGYESQELPYSNDFGADLIIDKGFNRIVIQAKNYIAGNVGNKAIQEVLSAKVHYKCDKAMVITNSNYTKNAIITAKSNNVILVDRKKLIKIINEGRMYFNSLV